MMPNNDEPERREPADGAWLRSRQIDRSKWTPLPDFKFRLELQNPETLLRPFIKTMFSIVAAGAASIYSGAAEEIQLVMLAKCSIDGIDATYRAYIPNPAIAQFAINHLPPLLPMSASDAVSRGLDLNIQHSYRCPLDLLFPVVIVVRPQSRLVLLANQNHFADAEQFLRAQLCRTTSGFLNFLGSMSIAVGDSKRTIQVRDKEAAEQSGLYEWLRWLRHITDHGKWETSRILVNASNPEEYVYDYSPTDHQNNIGSTVS